MKTIKPAPPKPCEICGETRHAYFTKLNGKVLCRKHWSEALLLSVGKAAIIITVLVTALKVML